MATPRRRNISENVRVLHNALTKILNDHDRAYFIQSLNQYQKDRDVIELVASLKSILDSPRKQEIYPLLRAIIPASDKRYFEKTWQAGSRPQSLHSSKEWTSLTRPRSQSRPEPLKRSNIYASLPENLDKYDSGIDLANLRTNTTKYPIRRLYLKRGQGAGFGFSMRGGSEHGVGLYVSSVDDNSLAEYEGLMPGDHILSVNEIRFDGLNHDQAVKIIKNNKKLNMVVRSVGCIPNTFVAESTYKWIDLCGRRVSPPPNVDSSGREMSLDGIHRSDLRLLGDDDERKVNIFVEDGDKLGLKIRGGSEYGLGIYIAGVDVNSAADKAGLRVGDQIMDVNGVSFLNITHADAVKVLKSARNMMVTMKDVGRLPFAKTTTDKTKWKKGQLPNTSLQSDSESIYTTAQVHAPPDNRRNTTSGVPRLDRRTEESKFQAGLGGSQLMYNGIGLSQKSLTEDQARQILNDNEFGTLTYYLQEYRKGFITVDSFVLALFSLLDTPAKVSLLTDIRGSILPKDIDRYDELVLKKEIDAIKTRNMTVVNDDVRSIHSCSESSLSNYSERSSSSRSSTKNSYHIDSRPITPPRVPDVHMVDKTVTKDDTNTLPVLAFSNGPFHDYEDSTLNDFSPICSSSPRDPKQRKTRGENTEYHITGENTRNGSAPLVKPNPHKLSKKPLKSRGATANGDVEEELPFKALTAEFAEEKSKKEKRGFSLFGHSKFKASYSPYKQQIDHSNKRDLEVTSVKKSHGKDTSKPTQHQNSVKHDITSNESGKHQYVNTNFNHNGSDQRITSSLDETIKSDDVANAFDETQKTGASLNETLKNSGVTRSNKAYDIEIEKRGRRDDTDEPEYATPFKVNVDLNKPTLQRSDKSQDKHKGTAQHLSAFAPPKPRRSFHLLEEQPTCKMDDTRVDHQSSSVGDSAVKDMAPPKPKPYSDWLKDNIKESDSDTQGQEYDEHSSGRITEKPQPELSGNAWKETSSSSDSVPLNHTSERTRPSNSQRPETIEQPSISAKSKPMVSHTNEEAETKKNSLPSDYLQSENRSNSPVFSNTSVVTQKDDDVKSIHINTNPVVFKTNDVSQKKELTMSSDFSQSTISDNDSINTDKVTQKKNDHIAQDVSKIYTANNNQINIGKVTQKKTNHISLNNSKLLTSNNKVNNKVTNWRDTKSSVKDSTQVEQQKDGMFLAMEENASNRSGLERSTCWGDESSDDPGYELLGLGRVSPMPEYPLPYEEECESNSISAVEDSSNNDAFLQSVRESMAISANNSIVKERSSMLQNISSGVKHSNWTNSSLSDRGTVKDTNNNHIESKHAFKSQSICEHSNSNVSSQNNEDSKTKTSYHSPERRSSSKLQTISDIEHSGAKVLLESDKEDAKNSDSFATSTNPNHVKIENNAQDHRSGSLVRNMVNVYNHMNSDQHEIQTGRTDVKRSNRTSWDCHENATNRLRPPSPASKRTLKSNSDSNLMNLPKGQEKDIQVKIRASQELLDLRQQQTAKTKESTSTNSPSQNASDGYIVEINKKDTKGLGLTVDGGSDVTGADSRITVKSVKEGPYAAYLSGKLRPGQEIHQINGTPTKGMTNAMVVLTLRQAYADEENDEQLTLVVNDP